MQQFWGIACGFATAILMACSYIASGWAIRRTPGLNAPTLLANAFIWMGLACVFGMALTWRPEILHGFWPRFPPVVLSLSCYALAQILMFIAQRKIDASLLVPLLGLKLPILMLLNLMFLGTRFTWMQVLAVVLTVLAAFLLNRTGKGIPRSSFCLVIVACTFFSLSDMGLKLEMDLLQNELGFSPALAAIYCTYLNYLTGGILGGALTVFLLSRKPLRLCPDSTSVDANNTLPPSGSNSHPPQQQFPSSSPQDSFPSSQNLNRLRILLRSLPYGLIWIVAIIFLNICFALLGTVNGNIIQSTRGIFSILFSPILVACGLTYLEERVFWTVILRRLLAACMMAVAIYLYNFK
ncbi:MAG: EamA family transporter [Victivallales bacterium]|nr:EamA family transporter [Victivallales bacterium]